MPTGPHYPRESNAFTVVFYGLLGFSVILWLATFFISFDVMRATAAGLISLGFFLLLLLLNYLGAVWLRHRAR